MTDFVDIITLRSIVEKILSDNGIQKDTQDWREYSRAKLLLPPLTSNEYHFAIKVIYDWINV